MIKEEQSVLIERPIDEVFSYVSDLRHSAEWQAGIMEVRKTTEGALGVGTKYTFARKFLGKTLEANNEFVAFEPNTKVVFRIFGPMPGEAAYLFEPVAEATKVTSTLQFNPAGFSRLAEPFIATSMRRDMAANLGELKRLLEGQAGKS